MRFLLLFLAVTAFAQSAPQTYPTYTAENLRGVSAVSRQIAQLKLDLKAAEETGEYAPLYGTDKGGVRRSSNF